MLLRLRFEAENNILSSLEYQPGYFEIYYDNSIFRSQKTISEHLKFKRNVDQFTRFNIYSQDSNPKDMLFIDTEKLSSFSMYYVTIGHYLSKQHSTIDIRQTEESIVKTLSPGKVTPIPVFSPVRLNPELLKDLAPNTIHTITLKLTLTDDKYTVVPTIYSNNQHHIVGSMSW